jgi:hypothetical protein
MDKFPSKVQERMNVFEPKSPPRTAEYRTYLVLDCGKAILCKRCGRISYNQGDVINRWCAYCEVSHDDLHPFGRRQWVEYPDPSSLRVVVCEECGYQTGFRFTHWKEIMKLGIDLKCLGCGTDITQEVKKLGTL